MMVLQKPSNLQKIHRMATMRILKAYQFDSEDKALTMENVMRSFFCHYFPDRFTEKDRFDWEILPSISEEMWEKLETKINEVERLFVF